MINMEIENENDPLSQHPPHPSLPTPPYNLHHAPYLPPNQYSQPKIKEAGATHSLSLD
jgi:hypothetical protein